MKKYLVLYRPFLIFLAKFFLTYLVLSLIYQGYLSRFDRHSVDDVTELVAANTVSLVGWFETDFDVKPLSNTATAVFYFRQVAVARMIEGCNAVSVIILFVAFVVSFSGRPKSTLLFILGGSLFIYALNVIRIALLCWALYWFPEQQSFLHEIVFPLFIYGVVFILWVIWVNKFSLYAK